MKRQEADTIKEAETKEKKLKKSTSGEWENYSNQTIYQKSHQMNKHPGSLLIR